MFKNFSVSSLISGLRFSKRIVTSIFDSFLQIRLATRLFYTHIVTFRELKKLNCTLEQLKESYIYMGFNHLEVFTFNGLIIENTYRISDIFPNITALDNNEESLNNFQRTLDGYFCRINPVLFDIHNFNFSSDKKFDSISLNFALDQIQGGTEKVEEFILKIKNLLTDGSIVFGLTTLGVGLNHKKNALDYIKLKNDKKEWFNINFSLSELETILKNNFDQYGILNYGSCVIFRGIINKKIPDLRKHRPSLESLKGKHLKIKSEDFHIWVKNLDKFKD